jgi:hypothetical protein
VWAILDETIDLDAGSTAFGALQLAGDRADDEPISSANVDSLSG